MKYPHLDFFVSGKAEPEPRHRSERGRARHDGRADAWKCAVRLAAFEALGIEPADGPSGRPIGRPVWAPESHRPVFPAGVPVVLGLEFWLRRPPTQLTQFGKLIKGAPLVPVGKPDLDNLIKAVKDALGDWLKRGSILWHDDAQVVQYMPCPVKLFDDHHPAGCRVQASCWTP